MSVDLASLAIRVDTAELRVAQLELERLNGASNRTGEATTRLSSIYTKLGTVIAGIGFSSIIKSSIDAADALNDLSFRTGIAVRDLAGIRLAAEQSGATIDSFSSAINLLNVNMGNNGKAFKQLGIDAQSPLEAFYQLAGVMESINDPQTRAAVGAQALGRGWAELAPLLALGEAELRKAVASGSELSGVTQQLANDADQFNDQLAEMQAFLSGVATSLAGPIIGGFNQLISHIRAASEEGVTFINVLKGVMNFATGQEALSGLNRQFKDVSDEVEKQEKKVASLSKYRSNPLGALIQDLSGVDIEAQKSKLDSLYKKQDEIFFKLKKSSEELKAEASKPIDPVAINNFLGTAEKTSNAISHKTGAIKSAKIAHDDYSNSIKAATQAIDYEQQAIDDYAKNTLEGLVDQYNRLTLSARKYLEVTLQSKGLTPEQSAPILSQFDKNTAFEKAASDAKAATDQINEYSNSIDSASSRISGLGDISSAVFDGALGGISAMAGAFEAMIQAIDDNTAALAENKKMQLLNDKEKDGPEKIANALKFAKQQKKIEDDLVSSKLSGYRQIAAGFEGMLKKGSAEQKAAHAITVTIAGIEAALNLQKILGIGAATAAETASVGPSIAASTAKTIPKVAEGAATFFAQSGWLGFAGVAAMIAALAALGFAASGSGGSGGAHIPESPTSGTVLGDSSAKSESIKNLMDLLESIHAKEYRELRSIDDGIKNLSGGITDAVTQIFRDGGLKVPVVELGEKLNSIGALIQAGSGIGKLDPIANKILGSIFGTTKKEITELGIEIKKINIGALLDGAKIIAKQFAVIKTTTSSIFGSSSSEETVYSNLSKETNRILNQVYQNIGKTLLSIAQGLGDAIGQDLPEALLGLTIPRLRVNLQGLSGKKAAEKLNNAISTMVDKVATKAFGDIVGEYQQLGEGMLETAGRIVAQIVVVREALRRNRLEITGDIVKITDAIAQAAGGIEEFQKQFQTFFESFFTEAEQRTHLGNVIDDQLSDLNLILPKTREGYRALVEALDINNEADQKRYSLLIGLAEAADEYYSMLEELGNNRRDLELQWMQQTGHGLQAIFEKRKDELKALDESLRPMQAFIFMITDANEALQKATDRLAGIAKSLRSALTSTIAESDNLARQRRLSAQSVLQSALIIAKAGGSIENIAGLDQAIQDIKAPNQAFYKDFIEYARDQGRTADTITQLADYADNTVSIAQQQLDAINGTTDAVLTVREALLNIADITAGGNPLFTGTAPTASQQANADLLLEIQYLRQEVARLQASNQNTSEYSKRLYDLMRNVTQDGQSLLTTPA